MAMDGKALLSYISIIFSLTMGLLVVLGSLVMMYGNFELGVVLFTLGLVLVISNEGLLPYVRRATKKTDTGLVEEIANLAAIGYTPTILVGSYLYMSGQSDVKLILFMALSFTVVTMKIIAKIVTIRYAYRAPAVEEVYTYTPKEEGYNGPGV